MPPGRTVKRNRYYTFKWRLLFTTNSVFAIRRFSRWSFDSLGERFSWHVVVVCEVLAATLCDLSGSLSPARTFWSTGRRMPQDLLCRGHF